MRPLGFFIDVRAGAGLGKDSRRVLDEQYSEFGRQGSLLAEAQDVGGLFAAVDGRPIPAVFSFCPGVTDGRQDGDIAFVQVVPVNFQAVGIGTGDEIADQPEPVFESENVAVMDYRIVSVVEAGEEVAGFAGVPAVYGDFGRVFPGKGTGRRGLVASIDLEGIMGGGAAEAVAFRADVAVSARIDQD